jgi:hypothetical protein
MEGHFPHVQAMHIGRAASKMNDPRMGLPSLQASSAISYLHQTSKPSKREKQGMPV